VGFIGRRLSKKKLSMNPPWVTGNKSPCYTFFAHVRDRLLWRAESDSSLCLCNSPRLWWKEIALGKKKKIIIITLVWGYKLLAIKMETPLLNGGLRHSVEGLYYSRLKCLPSRQLRGRKSTLVGGGFVYLRGISTPSREFNQRMMRKKPPSFIVGYCPSRFQSGATPKDI